MAKGKRKPARKAGKNKRRKGAAESRAKPKPKQAKRKTHKQKAKAPARPKLKKPQAVKNREKLQIGTKAFASKGGKARAKQVSSSRGRLKADVAGAKISRSKSATFSTTGLGRYAGGGYVAFHFSSQSEAQLKKALALLRKLKHTITQWQVSQRWIVNHRRKRSTIGYSPMRTRNMISMKELIKALTESAENAARRVGFSLKYEGKIPNQVEYPQRRKKLKRNGKIVTVTSKKTDFDVIVWFNGEQQARQTYLK